MDDVYAALSAKDRRLLDRVATGANVSIDALLPEIVSAYLRLMRDVPDALPSDQCDH